MDSPLSINPFLWFENQAEEAALFYVSLFKNSRINTIARYSEAAAKASGRTPGSVMTVSFKLEGQDFAAINGGPIFSITPAISFFVNCGNAKEINSLWEKLSEGGKVMMELDSYPFSERYGWIQDRFGVSWQLIMPERKQKITPCLMFAGDKHKKAEEAINFYISVFSNPRMSSGSAGIIQLERYTSDQGPEGAIIHSKFVLNGQEFTAMDSHQPMPYPFSPAISFVVNCRNQQEIDYYWEKLSAGGDEGAQQCGWLADKYGLSWQIVPASLSALMSEPLKAQKVMSAILQMKKINLNELLQIQ